MLLRSFLRLQKKTAGKKISPAKQRELSRNEPSADVDKGEVQYATSKNEETDDTAWMLVCVNAKNPLESVPNITFTKLSYGVTVDRRMYPDLQEMMDDARREGLSPMVCSGFRSVEDQQELYEDKVRQFLAEGFSQSEAEAESIKWVAYPGTSEHHTGLAVDIVSVYNQRLDSTQENTPEQQWLMENSWKYGFILRYPNGKTDITGIYYEPWHYRYVGKEAAAEIYESKLTLEEYLGKN